MFDNIDNNKPNGKNDVSFLDEALYKECFVNEIKMRAKMHFRQ